MSQELRRGLSVVGRVYARQILRDYWEVFDGVDLGEAMTQWNHFVTTWYTKEPRAIGKLMEKKDHLFLYYAYPVSWRHRIRTVNLAEVFFSHVQELLRRWPGWFNKDHITYIVGLYIQGMKIFRRYKITGYQTGVCKFFCAFILDHRITRL